MRKCPFCAEEIQDAAKLCKHCGRDLPRPDPAAPVASTWEDDARRLAQSGDTARAIQIIRQQTGVTFSAARQQVYDWRGDTAPPVGATSRKKVGLGCLTVVGLMLLAVMITPSRPTPAPTSGTTPTPAAPAVENMLADIHFDGAQFVVTNENDIEWIGVKLAVNYGGFDSGFTYTTPRMESGETYRVGALQFANDDGVRFNPMQLKPQKFMVSARIRGQAAYYAVTFR